MYRDSSSVDYDRVNNCKLLKGDISPIVLRL